jgi:opacity protein-like surface antigen
MRSQINLLSASVTFVAFAFGTQVHAQTYYVGGEAGWSSLEDQRDRPNVAAPAITSRFDDGFAVGARAGYEMGPWRFEGEYAYREQGQSSIRVGGVGTFGASGDRHAHAVMGNVLYDVPLGAWMPMMLPLTPHIGAGIGAVNLTDTVRVAGRRNTDDDWVFGYQAIGGVRYNFSPALALDVDYKYFATEDARFRINGTGITYRSGYESHNIMASLIYRFAAPPPPAPVAAPLPPAPPPPAPVAVPRVRG